MRGIDSAELARMINSAEESLNDLCSIYTFNGTADSLGEISKSWDSGRFSVPCGFVEVRELRTERLQAVSTVDADAFLRLADSTLVGVRDKVVVGSKTYYADGIVPGRTVQIVWLKELNA